MLPHRSNNPLPLVARPARKTTILTISATGRQGRQPNRCFRTGAITRSRWSLDFVKFLTLFEVSITPARKYVRLSSLTWRYCQAGKPDVHRTAVSFLLAGVIASPTKQLPQLVAVRLTASRRRRLCSCRRRLRLAVKRGTGLILTVLASS